MQSPDDPPPMRQRWVSFDEARMILRMSEGTLRREIRAGRVTAEKRRRNPDSPTDLREVYEVLVTDPPASASHSESDQPPDIRHESPAAPDPVVPALLAKLDERDETIRDQAEQIAHLNAELRDETAKRAAAESDARHLSARATAEAARADRAAQRADDLARQLTEMQATLAHERVVSEQNVARERVQSQENADLAAALDRERAAREQAEQRLRDRRWWNPSTW